MPYYPPSGGGGAVSSVAGRTGAVTIGSADLTDATTAGKALVTAASAASAVAGVGAVQAALTTTVSTAPYGTNLPGWLLHLILNYSTPAGATDPEPIFVESYAGSSLHRAFWLNESGSPRGASIESEPAMKLFGPENAHSYAGEVLSLYNWWTGSGSQVHLWGVNMAGQPVVGSGSTVGSNVVLLGLSDTVPTGLPVGTVIARKTV